MVFKRPKLLVQDLRRVYTVYNGLIFGLFVTPSLFDFDCKGSQNVFFPLGLY